MSILKMKDGFPGELQINIPRTIVVNQLRKQQFLSNLFITHIGYFPNAKYHYRERLHGSPDNILIYCMDGKGYYRTTDSSFVLQRGQFCILPRGQYHMYQADVRTPWSIYWVHFSGDMIKEFNEWINIDAFIKPTPLVYDKRIIEVWNEMYFALSSGFNRQNIMHANFSLHRFLSFFVSTVEYSALFSNIQRTDSVDNSINYMKANIGSQITIKELANKEQLSVSRYTMLFKAKTGSSPIDFFINLKMQHACLLLEQSNLKIFEISDMVGYNDSLYFSRIFKKIVGSSPLKYKGKALVKKN